MRRRMEAPCSAPTSAGGPDGEVVLLFKCQNRSNLKGLGAVI
ncbi:hypothetical protein [Neobacillus terrae]|nr:hypothetical protein [Neobacillus terrae]